MMRSRCESIPKQPEVELTFARDGEVAEDFADGAGEFEAVAGARAGDDHLRMRGMAIDPEVFVGRVGVEADGSGAESAVGLREVTAQQSAGGFHFVGRDVARDEVGRNVRAVVVPGDLHAFAEIGKAVEESASLFAANLPEVDRAAFGVEEFRRALRLEPEEGLAFDGERRVQIRKEFPGPTAGGENHLGGAVGAFGGDDFHAVFAGGPAQDGFFGS